MVSTMPAVLLAVIAAASRVIAAIARKDIKMIMYCFISYIRFYSHDGWSLKLMMGFFMPASALTINSTSPP